MKCFYHDDMDGRCAASIVSAYTGNRNKEDYISLNYPKHFPVELISKGEAVYIVDISFGINDIENLENILKITNNVTWIDHHQSTVDMINATQNESFKNIKGVISTHYCGAYLTYKYFYNNKEVPEYIKYVDDHDCWKCQLLDSKYFFLGISSKKHDALDRVWGDLRENLFDVSYFVSKGITIWEYLESIYKQAQKTGYEVTINDIKAFVINSPGNSWVFGDLIEKYPFVILWTYEDGKYLYSFYSSNKSDFNCQKLAEKFGGGGHPHASGCSSNELLFVKDGNIKI